MRGSRRALRRVVVAVAATALALAVSATSTSQAAQDCRTRGTTIEANAHARLFSTFDRRTRARRYYACRVASRRTALVGRNDPIEDGVAGTLDLSGFHVLYEDVGCNRDTGCSVQVLLMDTRSPRKTRLVAQLHEPTAPAIDLVLTRDRTAVWIRPVDGGHEIARGRPGEAVTVLASGAGIEPHSLAVAGNRIYWTDAGQPQSASTH